MKRKAILFRVVRFFAPRPKPSMDTLADIFRNADTARQFVTDIINLPCFDSFDSWLSSQFARKPTVVLGYENAASTAALQSGTSIDDQLPQAIAASNALVAKLAIERAILSLSIQISQLKNDQRDMITMLNGKRRLDAQR